MAITFGAGYTPVENSGLDVGDYKVKIVNLSLDHYNNGNQFLNVIVEVEGHPNAMPNTITLNDRPVLGTIKASGTSVDEKDVRKWDRTMTRFFDCFGITRGDFNMQNWRFKEGMVHCDWQYDASEPDNKSKKFKQLTPIADKKASATTVSQSASQPAQATPQASQSTPSASEMEGLAIF